MTQSRSYVAKALPGLLPRWRRLGLVVLALYAAVGFDGLLHYTRAPFAAHTGTMNLTMWSEVGRRAGIGGGHGAHDGQGRLDGSEAVTKSP